MGGGKDANGKAKYARIAGKYVIAKKAGLVKKIYKLSKEKYESGYPIPLGWESILLKYGVPIPGQTNATDTTTQTQQTSENARESEQPVNESGQNDGQNQNGDYTKAWNVYNSTGEEAWQYVDDIQREAAGKAWNSMTKDEKYGLFRYTGAGYGAMNYLINTGDVDPASESTRKAVRDAVTGIYKSELPVDTVGCHGTRGHFVKDFFGTTDVDELQKMAENGDTVKIGNFVSMGSTEDTGFHKPYMVYFEMPKGTKALYAEPISSVGDGDGLSWNGKSKQYSYSSEFETLLAPGATVAIQKAELVNGITKVYVRVISQEMPDVSKY